MKITISRLELNNFGYIIAIANIKDKHDRSTPSHYHWKILKCRMIIFSNASILAAPDKNDLQHVHIVFNKSGDDYDKINSLLLKFSLVQDGGIRETTPEIFQTCFNYTMTARIAPTWNTLGDKYLICNRDFLITKGFQEGVYYEVMVNDQNILSLEIKSVKINLMISEEVFMPGEWIRVLPSLNKATIDEYYETIPAKGKFGSYKDLRRHWKNIHGYRLPEEENSYYTVQFWRGEPLLYPKMCVIRNFPIITPTTKPVERAVVQKFLNCVNVKLSIFFQTALTIENVEQELQEDNIDTVHVAAHRHSLPETQAYSLCTPTQSTKHHPGNR